jgi:hypothetical protein
MPVFRYWDRLYYSTLAALHRPSPRYPRPNPRSWITCFDSSGQVVSIHHILLKKHQIPQTWMLLQGLMLSVITILVTIRISCSALVAHYGVSRLTMILSEWVRKACVVLAVASERWAGDSIKQFERLVEALAQDSLEKLIQMTSTGDDVQEGDSSLTENSEHAPHLTATEGISSDSFLGATQFDNMFAMLDADCFDDSFPYSEFSGGSLRDGVLEDNSLIEDFWSFFST